jgi:hypothetical protein
MHKCGMRREGRGRGRGSPDMSCLSEGEGSGGKPPEGARKPQSHLLSKNARRTDSYEQTVLRGGFPSHW